MQLPSQPSAASLLVLNLLSTHVTDVHVSKSEHVSQFPSSTSGQPVSHPFVASSSVLKKFSVHSTEVHPVVCTLEQAVQLPSVAGAHVSSHPLALLPSSLK